MARTSKEQNEQDVMKVIDALEQNSKKNIDEIAKSCGFSRQKVWRIIKKLEGNRNIWGYTAIVDAKIKDLQKFMLSIKRSQKMLDKKSINEIAYERLGKIILNLGVTIESSYYVHGEYDWILIFTAKNLRDAKKFTNILFSAYPGIIDKVNLSQILFSQRDHRIENPDQMKLMEFL